MINLSYNDTIKRLSFYSLLLLLGGCASAMSAYDTSSCAQRGGNVKYKCTFWYSDGTCQTYDNICVGAMTHEEYEQQQQQQLSNLSTAPLPKLSKLETWEKQLNRYGTKKWLTRSAYKYPKLSWLSSRWCLKGSDSKIAANYYNVEQAGNGSLYIMYNDMIGGNLTKNFTHVEITGNYFDLWDGTGFSLYLRDEGGRRLEKHSDEEFVLVYKFGSARPQGSDQNKTKQLKEFAEARALEIGPEKHIKNPEVYVKCK